MTTLLYVKDYLKTKLKVDEITLYFDEENLTNEEEILTESMIEEVLIKAKVSETQKAKEEGKQIHVKAIIMFIFIVGK
jgi:hypothetical protein